MDDILPNTARGATSTTDNNDLSLQAGNGPDISTSTLDTPVPPTSPSMPPMLSRQSSYMSYSGSTTGDPDEFDGVPPLDRLTVFDFLENLALPQRMEKLQETISAQKHKVRRLQERTKSSSKLARDLMVDEWRKRVPTSEEKLDQYRKRMRESVDRLNRRWTGSKAVTTREKVSFITSVLNIFLSGYLIGAFPQYFHYWYTAQIMYFMPIRYYTYHKRGYHYFLADLCYFVNLLLLLSIWVFPHSKRLFISTFCLAFGNNAVAIAMWRNSLVFHSLDKITSLFIHIMPCVTLHVIVHLVPPEVRQSRFPAVWHIQTSLPSSSEHYGLSSMILWSSLPYAFWQLSYHFLITVRKRSLIAAGRPTSFTWLRKSYAPTWIGKFVLSLPDALQETAFMFIQYTYALVTMLPAPLWFWSRWASAGFLGAVFIWSIHNGATYYIDVFGTRFQKELEKLRNDVTKWQMSPELNARSPMMGGMEAALSPSGTDRGMERAEGSTGGDAAGEKLTELTLGEAASEEIGAGESAATGKDNTSAGTDGLRGRIFK